ncbi:MAG TPA: (2Fe-2S)-binding protein [Usitatibacter sp.]|nr:(2Fe-2S)-binding protein [Usitatibacter sp.]
MPRRLTADDSIEAPSRRDFLKGTGAAIAGGVLVRPSQASAVEAAAIEAARVVRTFDVNGMSSPVEFEPQATLAEVLRGPLDLTGTKIGCDRGACGACTVWIDGAPVLSCMTLAVDVGARKVVTIEGLASHGELHPVQAAFIEHDAIQCGYCTPGMVMSCAALLARTPSPAREDVEGVLGGHLCRCGTYPHAVEATLAAAESSKR